MQFAKLITNTVLQVLRVLKEKFKNIKCNLQICVYSSLSGIFLRLPSPENSPGIPEPYLVLPYVHILLDMSSFPDPNFPSWQIL